MTTPPNFAAQPRPRRGGAAAARRGRPQSEYISRPPVGTRRPRSQVIEPSPNVFINYIPPNFTEADLRALCSQYGEIVSSKIMINLDTGQSKCFGFVKMKDVSQAAAVIRGIDGMTIGNKKLLAKYAESQEKREKISTMLYIKRLPMSVDSNTVLHLFSRYGEILQVSPHAMDSIEPQYWRCFVQFATQSQATEAMNAMNNQIIVEGTRPIHVRYADETRLSGTFVYPTPYPQKSTPSESSDSTFLPDFFFH